MFRTISKKEIHKAEEIIWTTTKGDIKIVSAHDIDIKTKNGVRLGDYEAVERKTSVDLTEVKEIKLIEAMDNGSANDGTGKLFQLGLVFGKSYTFQVVSYTKGTPKNPFAIKWVAKYHSITQNKWIEFPMVSLGAVSNLQFSNDVCGRFIYISAYINNKEEGGKLKLWVHNRFRWFDRKIVHKQAEERGREPWRIDQGGSSLCGMAALYYALIKRDSKSYMKLAKDLFRTGEGLIGSCIVKPHPEALEMYCQNPESNEYKNIGMPEVDWIVLATTRSEQSYFFNQLVYKGKEIGKIDMLKAVSWPRMMIRMVKEIAQFYTVNSIGLNEILIQQKKRPLGGRLYDSFSDSDLKHLGDMEMKFNKGHKILMMIDADMFKDQVSYSYSDIAYESHWVVYEGDLQFFDNSNNLTNIIGDAELLSFRVFTWGFNPLDYRNEDGVSPPSRYKFLTAPFKINVKSFKSNFYGYIEAY